MQRLTCDSDRVRTNLAVQNALPDRSLRDDNLRNTRACEHAPYHPRSEATLMSWYRRWRQEGGVYFFTVVTYGRRPILVTPDARPLLHAAIETTQAERPFQLHAVVLLPEHLHCLWILPPDDSDFATRWRLIKTRFTQAFLDTGYREPARNPSRRKRQEHAIWQRRFGEHLIRGEDDWKRHLDYIHYNPVKHGLAKAPNDWEYSSFQKFVKLGEYDAKWGHEPPDTIESWEPPVGGDE